MIFVFTSSISLAASPTLRDGVYSSNDIVTSIDNSQIVSADLDNFNFNLRISSVKEDDKNHYIDYSYQTLAILNSVWTKVSRDKTLTVSKEFLGDKDLGLYVARELGDNINYESSYLKKVQGLQKDLGVSKKVVTVEYSGLIGKLLDPKEKIIEGYDPVIPLVVPTPEVIPVVEPPATPPPTPTPTPALDEAAIRLIVEQYLIQHPTTPVPIPVTEPTPDPVPDPSTDSTDSPQAGSGPSAPKTIPTPTPDLDLVPAPEPVPDPEPKPTPNTEITPPPTTSEPVPETITEPAPEIIPPPEPSAEPTP